MPKLDLTAESVKNGTKMLDLIRKSRRLRRMFWAVWFLGASFAAAELIRAIAALP